MQHSAAYYAAAGLRRSSVKVWLDDSVLGVLFPVSNHYDWLGDWTEIRNLANNSNLAAIGFDHGLDACINLNPGTTTVSKNSMATTMEAIIGAVQLDGSPDALLQLLTRFGLVHEMLTSVMLKSLLSLYEQDDTYTVDVMTLSALPLGISRISTHGFYKQHKNEPTSPEVIIPHIVKVRPMVACT